MLTFKRSLRAMSLVTLVTFVSMLCAPIVEASQAAATASAAVPAVDKVVQASQTGLSNLWFFWTDHLKTVKVTPDREAAYSFFSSRGATDSQAQALTANAEASGMLTTKIASATQAGTGVIKSFWNKITSPFRAQTATSTGLPKGIEPQPGYTGGVQATVTKTPMDSVKSFFSRFGKGGQDATAATAAGVPAQSTDASAALAGEAAKPGLFAKIGTGIKNGADSLWLGARRAGSTVGAGAKTGALTLADKLDFNRYYEIPLTDTSAIKVRGEFKGVTKFTEKGWVVEKYVGTSKTPGSLGDQLGQIEAVAAKPAPTGFFGKIFSKFSDSVRNLKNKMTGKGYTTPETQMELNKLQIEGNLLEQSRMLNEAQRAIKYRMDNLTGSAQSLRKPVPQEQITALQKQYDAIENTKQELNKRISGVQQSSARSVVKDAIQWGLFSIGITASVNIIKQVVSGEKVDIKKAFTFMGEPSFWGGTAGGFLGATLVRSLTANLLPPGVGMFLQVLPGFLGAALGFELGSGLFGGEMDLLGSLVQTLASAGGYALAASFIGPGFPAILASIVAGSIASFILNKIRGGFTTEAYTVPEAAPEVQPTTETIAASDVVATGVAAPVTMSLADAEAKVKDSYNRYIEYLKQRKLADARVAHEDYMSAKQMLETVKAGSVSQ